MVTPLWFVALGLAWMVVRKRPRHIKQYRAFQAELAEDATVAAAGKGD